MSEITFKYFDRDLSWLQFNHRVLQEMRDTRNPLLERLKFAAIFSSNMEEFYEVRISEIRRIKTLDKPLRKKLITKPNRLLRNIKKQINILNTKFDKGLFEELIPSLRQEGYHILSPENYSPEVQQFCVDYFKKHLKKDMNCKSRFVTDEERLFIKSGGVYLAGKVDETLHIYELPRNHKRFVAFEQDGKKQYLFLDDLIREHLKKKHEKTTFYSFNASRDAELYILDEYEGNLKDKIESALSNRETGQFTTVLIDSEMPEDFLELLYLKLDINEADILLGGRYHKLKDLFSVDFLGDDKHQVKTLAPIRSAHLAKYESTLSAIQEKDQLLYYPYESFDQVVRFANEVSKHPDVVQIKATLYRVSKDSAIAKALLEALKNGKNVCVFIETKARFDESNNLHWGDKLAKAGANVIYSYAGVKVHSKIMYVEAVHDGVKKSYAYIGTGNFNEKTSKIYTDYGLMTANKKITKDISRVFEFLERKVILPKTKRIWVSPFNTRRSINKKIQDEIEFAKEGKDAYLIFKMNSLQDKALITSLYHASNSGVQIKLLVRGICCLIPGVEGMSENIEIISVVDRFLEHGRVYIFGNNGEEEMYIGSADLMTRNLDNRVEVLAPIISKDIYKKIKDTLMLQFEDKVKARIIDENQANHYKHTHDNYLDSSQHEIYEYIYAQNQAGESK